MKLVEHQEATSTTAEVFRIISESGVQYKVSAPFEIKGLFKKDWSAYVDGRGARFVTDTKPGQAAIEFAKNLQQ
jgi:hypothetical protein